ncbi:MAG: hypothetical protein AAF490_14935 [Chloroflexota bacterium]
MLGLDEALVHAVLEDWRTAPVDNRMRAILGYLEKLTLHPEQLGPADMDELLEAGLSKTAVYEAGYVCFLFSIIDRLADAFDFTIPDADLVASSGRFLNRFGYTMTRYLP